MCVIIDNNLAFQIFRDQPESDYLPVFNWLHSEDKNGRLVYGGRLRDELVKREGTRRYLRSLYQAGRAHLVPDSVVQEMESQVKETGLCRSDDPHVIALARISGARTLCSKDKTLHQDFKNPRLISKPKGCIYQTANHARLLRHTSSCRWNAR
jgi:hypothetical protein